MSLDGNHPTQTLTASTSDGSTWQAFLVDLRAADLDTSWIVEAVQDNAAWLQGTPRVVTEIVSKLLPGAALDSKALAVMATFLGGFLYEAGYAPQFDNPDYPTWYWQEGVGSANAQVA